MTFMRKRYLRFAAIVCALAYLGAIGAGATRIIIRAADLERIAAAEFTELVERANAAASLGFLDEPFRDSIRQSLQSSQSLAAVIVTGPMGPEYAVERDGGYLASGGEPRFASRFELASAPLVAHLRVESARNATVSVARFRAMPEEIVDILRDSLLMTLLPLIAAFILLLFTTVEPSKKEAAAHADGDSGNRETRGAEFDEEFEIPEIAPDVAADEPISPVGLYGPDGVLGWESYLLERLESELRRSASFEQDIVLLAAELEAYDEEVFRTFANELVEFFSFRDLAFKRGKSGAAVILPNTELEQGMRLAEEFLEKWRTLHSDAENMVIGLSARAGRLVDASRLLSETGGAMERARQNGRFQIMAFKPDPERYRAFLAHS